MQPVSSITNWGEAMMTSITGALILFLGTLPKVIGFIIILVVGWFIAGLIAKALAAVLRKVHFDELATRSGFSGFIDQMGIKPNTVHLVILI